MKPSVTIVGGGLAGMIGAIALLEQGFAVRIIESTHRLGGKAGANKYGSDWDEHGWHLFPTWYLNIWSLVDKLGMRESFVDKSRYGYMKQGEYPKYVYLETPFSWKTSFHNLFHGVLPPWDSFLYQYALLDLMAQPYRHRAELDQVTINGFARSRFYGTETVVSQIEDTVSRASAIESYEMSSMTVRNVMRFWFNYHEPWFRILKGNLQSRFIQPIEDHLRKLGCEIILNTRVTDIEVIENRISSVMIQRENNQAEKVSVESLLVTTPPEDTKKLLNESLIAAAPELGQIYYLRSRVMAGMTIYLNKLVDGIPRDHINFVQTKYSLSIIDVTELWGYQDKSVICVVVSDYTTLQGHDPKVAQEIIVRDLEGYLPFINLQNIERVDFQPHVAHPLFANTAGAWPKRPQAVTAIENLYMAGDYCRSHVDLTCMEGAVSTGLLAAEAIRLKANIGAPITILQPKTKPRLLLVFLKCLLFPGALIALAISSLMSKQK